MCVSNNCFCGTNSIGRQAHPRFSAPVFRPRASGPPPRKVASRHHALWVSVKMMDGLTRISFELGEGRRSGRVLGGPVLTCFSGLSPLANFES